MAYNEVVGLPVVVAEAEAVLEGVDYEILLIDDGSSDGTGELARALELARPRVRLAAHGDNRGLGGVYRTGFSEAGGDWLTFLPADGELPPSNIPAFLQLRHGYDLLLGTIPNRTSTRFARLLSFLERLLYRCLFGPMPPFQGLFMIRVAVLRSCPLKSQGRGWAVVTELFLRVLRAGHPWRNIDTVMAPRLSGASKVRNLRTIFENLLEVLKLRLLL